MLAHATILNVSFGDCDPAGIVFYPNFFRWSDMGFGNMIKASGLELQMARRFPLMETGSKFKAPAAFGDRIELLSRITEARGKIVKVSHTFLIEGFEAAECWEVRVWVAEASLLNPKALKAEIIPEAVAAVLLGAT